MRLIKIPLLMVLVLLVAAGCQQRTPQGDERDAEPVRKLIGTLQDYHGRFQQLLEMRERLAAWHAKLNRENARLAKAAGDQGAWDQKSQAAAAALKTEVARFNAYVQRFNKLARKLARHLDDRSPQQVRQLMDDMDHLVSLLREQLKARNYVKADFIARNSQIAGEFGYRTH